jgi:hypothetical protein
MTRLATSTSQSDDIPVWDTVIDIDPPSFRDGLCPFTTPAGETVGLVLDLTWTPHLGHLHRNTPSPAPIPEFLQS